MHTALERLKQVKLDTLEEVKLHKIKDELYKKEREIISYEEMLEEKRVVQLIKLNTDICEASESIKESELVTNKLIRHLRQLNLTYSFSEETLALRLQRVVED